MKDTKVKTDFTNPKEIYDFWEVSGFFSADKKSGKPKYSLLIPPPNLTGELHLGHAMQHSILDAVARYKRLRGFDVLLLPGVDHAGIQFEATFDKYLTKQNLSKQKLGREKWLELAFKFKDEVYKSVSSTWRFMGLSADWSREVFTLDEGPRKAVFSQFKTFFEKGFIYKGPYIVQWCPKDNTAIEDVEMEYETRKEKLYYVKYPISNFLFDSKLAQSEQFQISNKQKAQRTEYIIVATTRPETIFADTAVAVYPNHPKYKKFVGQKVINPLIEKEIQVLEDKRVEKGFGTGALKVTPAHDLLDWEIGKDHGLEILHAVGKDGRLSEIAGKFAGLKVGEGREKVVEYLKERGLVDKEEDYVHSVAVCERCKTVVEPLISEEWFVKVGDLAKGAIKVIDDGEIKFLPKNYSKILRDWLVDIHDWCISRSLWWGHRIPVWYKKSDKGKVISDKSDIKVSLESPGKGWVQDEQVLDTWFSSGLWPMSTLGWPENQLSVVSGQLSEKSSSVNQLISSKTGKPKTGKQSSENRKLRTDNRNLLANYFPWDFEISAPEIKYLWIARMIMLSKYFTDMVPFKTMFFHGMIRDLEGRKFSKSLGNGIDPNYLIAQWGVDATRMALYTYSIPGRDGRVSREILDERGKNFRNFATKLRNIARFILELKPDSTPGVRTSLSESTPGVESAKHWILAELDKTAKVVTKHLENLELHLAVEEIYEFVWHKFADKYIEETKESESKRVKEQEMLEHVLKQVLILLHPFMPFLTEEIYQKFEVKKTSIMLEVWPTSVKR